MTLTLLSFGRVHPARDGCRECGGYKSDRPFERRRLFSVSRRTEGHISGNQVVVERREHVEPVLLKSGAVHEAFLKDYVGKTDSALETYYRSLVFTGKAPMPKTLATDAEVVGFVEKTKGTIGYVASGTNTGHPFLL
jgi:hypothetical protein